jgi:polyisoprenyl-phosphate glycosyltransferase
MKSPASRHQYSAAVLSIVVPAYNEDAVLPEFHRRLRQVVDSLAMPIEILYVNDGSADRTLEVIRQLQATDDRIVCLDLSRNFGKEIALTAGLDHAVGEAVVVIDADLQDPPELIPEMVRLWREGHDVIYGQRISRDGESWLKKLTAHLFYRAMQMTGNIRIPKDTGDFRLMSRQAVDALNQLREQHRFMKGLFAWIGFEQVPLAYSRDRRYAGRTKFNYWKLWNFAVEGITSFTTAPLRIATYLGIAIAGIAFLYAALIIFKTLMYGNPVQGYPSLVVIVLFLGGVQLSFIGILGEYLGRIFNEAKNRPLYLLRRRYAQGERLATTAEPLRRGGEAAQASELLS